MFDKTLKGPFLRFCRNTDENVSMPELMAKLQLLLENPHLDVNRATAGDGYTPVLLTLGVDYRFNDRNRYFPELTQLLLNCPRINPNSPTCNTSEPLVHQMQRIYHRTFNIFTKGFEPVVDYKGYAAKDQEIDLNIIVLFLKHPNFKPERIQRSEFEFFCNERFNIFESVKSQILTLSSSTEYSLVIKNIQLLYEKLQDAVYSVQRLYSPLEPAFNTLIDLLNARRDVAIKTENAADVSALFCMMQLTQEKHSENEDEASSLLKFKDDSTDPALIKWKLVFNVWKVLPNQDVQDLFANRVAGTQNDLILKQDFKKAVTRQVLHYSK